MGRERVCEGERERGREGESERERGRARDIERTLRNLNVCDHKVDGHIWCQRRDAKNSKQRPTLRNHKKRETPQESDRTQKVQTQKEQKTQLISTRRATRNDPSHLPRPAETPSAVALEAAPFLPPHASFSLAQPRSQSLAVATADPGWHAEGRAVRSTFWLQTSRWMNPREWT